MIARETIERLIEISMEGTDLFLVDLTIGADNLIKVLIESDSGTSIEDCVKVSRGIEHNLDREVEDFELRVSSAGLDQPFKVKRQYVKNVGRDVVVQPLEGKKIEGELTSVEDDHIIVRTKEKRRIEGRKAKEWVETDHQIPFDQIGETKVVILFNKRK